MLPSPLHPAVVHFPIVFVFLLPVAGVVAYWLIRKGMPPGRAWLLPVVTAVAVSLSAWAAVETGESQEDRAERVAGEAAVSRHEESAERFLLVSAGVVGITALGLLRGRPGRYGRMAALAAAALLLILGYQVGESGGRLVYGDATHPGFATLPPDHQSGTDDEEDDE